MSKYRRRKSRLYDAISRFDGLDMSSLSEEDVQDVRGLVACGYLVFDGSREGMFLLATERARAVIDRE